MTDHKLLLTTHGKETLLFALDNAKPVYLTRAKEQTGGGIFLGRVENYLQNLKAAFVRFDDHEIGYLPLDEVPQGALLNRSYEKNDPLKAGDLLCVQMRQAARSTKQAKLSGYLTLHGDFAVLGLEKTGVGCSKTLRADVRSALITSFKERLAQAVSPDGPEAGNDGTGTLPADFSEHFGVILRTESGGLFDRFLAEGEDREEALQKTTDKMLEDICALFAKMTGIVREAKSRQPGCALYRADATTECNDRLLQAFHFLERAYPGGAIEIVCTDDALYDAAMASECASRETVSVRLNTEADKVYGVSSMLEDLTHRVVWLKSGAYLVIEETEAMTVVDVNSGKYTAKKDDDFLKVNLEAAEAVMREIRLRDFSGIIVVDFINMREGASVASLKEQLSALAALDPVHTRFHDITALGLAEITRAAH